MNLDTEEGRAYLTREYVEKLRSPYDIAEELGTHPNTVRRALCRHGFPLRSRSEAQRAALATGRRNAPMVGRRHDEDTKLRISEAVAQHWKAEDHELRGEAAREQWQATPAGDRERLQHRAQEAILRAAAEGSRLEQFLAEGLEAAGHVVLRRARVGDTPVDLYLEGEGVAVDVLGPAHFLPIWGEATLERVRAADRKRAEALSASGVRLVRVKNVTRTLSWFKMRGTLERLTAILASGESGAVELEVDH